MKQSVGELLSSELKIAGSLTEKTNPRLLVEIITSLIEKSRTLIKGLEKALAKVDALEKEGAYWKHRYYSFKHSCNEFLEKSSHLDKAEVTKLMNSAHDSIQASRLTTDIATTVKKELALAQTPYFRPEQFTQERERLKSSESDRIVTDLVQSKHIPKGPAKVSVDLRKSIGSLSLSKNLRQQVALK